VYDSKSYSLLSLILRTSSKLSLAGKRHYLHNGDLAKDHIINHSRSSKVDISIELGISLDTSTEALDTIKVCEEFHITLCFISIAPIVLKE
jgi:hypothetical protein